MDPELQWHFEFLFEELKTIAGSYMSYTITTSASILVAIGWLLTSDKAREFIGSHLAIKRAGTVVVAGFFLAEVWIGWMSYGNSQRTTGLLEAVHLPGVTHAYYAAYVITAPWVLLFLVAHAILYGFLVVLLWKIRAEQVGSMART